MTKPSKDEHVFVQFNFEWTKKMRRDAEEAMRLEGGRVLAEFIRKAVADRIRTSQEKKSAGKESG